MRTVGDEPARFHWICKARAVEVSACPSIIGNEAERRKEHADARYRGRLGHDAVLRPRHRRMDMHVTIVSLHPGAGIPLTETHVMEHGPPMCWRAGDLQAEPRLGRGRGRAIHGCAPSARRLL